MIKISQIIPRPVKRLIKKTGFNLEKFYHWIGTLSLKWALKQQGLDKKIAILRKIAPDISNQESVCESTFNEYWEFKRRALHSFQCCLMLKGLSYYEPKKLTVVDIGDSAGTHMLYLKELTRGKYDLNTISVNLDPRAIRKIEARGQKAIFCRAEELDIEDNKPDLFTSFQMLEHLHDPANFLRRLAKKSSCNRFIITVPYLKISRVGLHCTRSNADKIFFAEDEHIFELSPEDWSLLMMHSGWKVIYSQIFYQYPRRWPVISFFLSRFWRKTDYEGFWGVILEKDTAVSDLYQDWKDRD